MAKQTGKQRDKTPEPQKRPKDPKEGERQLDIVEQAGKESFPASDAPSWTP